MTVMYRICIKDKDLPKPLKFNGLLLNYRLFIFGIGEMLTVTKNKLISLSGLVALLAFAVLFGSEALFKETTLIEKAKNSSYFEEDKPFLAESLVSGNMSYRFKSENGGAEIFESDAQELIELLSTTKVKKTFKSIESTEAKVYMIALDNSEVDMSYDLVVNFSMQKNKDDKVLITADYVDGTYVMENENFYNKIIEILIKAPSN